MKLYSFFRSSAAYRVRIALNLKGLGYEYLPVHLSRGGGEQLRPEFLGVNPQALVPVLKDGAQILSQSLAIIELVAIERNCQALEAFQRAAPERQPDAE